LICCLEDQISIGQVRKLKDGVWEWPAGARQRPQPQPTTRQLKLSLLQLVSSRFANSPFSIAILLKSKQYGKPFILVAQRHTVSTCHIPPTCWLQSSCGGCCCIKICFGLQSHLGLALASWRRLKMPSVNRQQRVAGGMLPLRKRL
jgi:hypothetical protein